MKLKKLFKNIKQIEIKGAKDLEITGICADSRLVSPGNLFIARRRESVDGTDYVIEAVEAGAVAVVTDVYDPFLKGVTQVIHENVSDIASDIAVTYYDNPSKQLLMIGVTGTNGKTTTSYLIKHILDKAKKSCGLLGTVEYILGKNSFFSDLTTPDSVLIQKYLKEMVEQGCQAAVLEVSSHGLRQKRVKNIAFDLAVFTNLSQDHLDYHSSFEDYAEAKKMLFDSLKEKSLAVVNLDDEWAAKMVEDSKAQIFSYGIDHQADFKAENLKFSLEGTKFDLLFENKREKFSSPLIGRFNVYNILAAIASCVKMGVPLEIIKKQIATFSGSKGRLERVPLKKSFFNVFIDFAHTSAALENVLLTLKEIKKGKIIIVFGCGGNRDKGKRPKMGKICAEHADFCILTSDNPRKEDPQQIISEIKQGFLDSKNYLIEVDRFEAIRKAINLAEKNDVVLIAGKGHETKQIFANKTILFNDREIAEQQLNERD